VPFKRHIPNTITCGNLFCGCLAVVKCFEGDLVWAAYLVGLAALLDFFDGFAARMLRVTSAIGKDLDSLADMVTFGLVPGLVMFKLILNANLFSQALDIYPPDSSAIASAHYLPAYIAFIIPVLSAVRLAKFNNDTRQTVTFIGLPTPANGIFICSLPLILDYNPQTFLLPLMMSPWALIVLSCVMAFLLLAEIPLFSLKFKTFSWLGNRTRYIFLLSCVFLFVLFKFVGLPLSIILYVVFSVAENFIKKQKS
jgi:CDP-diacylglycerol--serine O-phosphatidyltransferase